MSLTKIKYYGGNLVLVLLIFPLLTLSSPFNAKLLETNELESLTDEDIIDFQKQIEERWAKEPESKPPPFEKIPPPMSPINILDQYINDVIPAYTKMTRTCSDLTFYIRLMMDRIRTGGSLQEIELLFLSLCTAANMQQPVCKGFSQRLVPPLYFIVKDRSDLTPEIAVGVIFQHVGCTTNSSYVEWNVNDPPEQKDNVTMRVRMGKNLEDSKCLRGPGRPLKILHMTDIHVDPLYKTGANAACKNKILCCHEDDGQPENSTVAAGPYGSALACDIPLRTLESALKDAQKNHPDIDLFYMSGDLIPHNMWYTTREGNLQEIKNISDTIRNYFPNTTIVPILGNHEPHAVNMFAPVNIQNDLSTRWIFNGTYQSWLDWIPAESAEEYISTGHYSLKIWKGFRLLVLNTNLCFGFNFWQMYSFNDFKEQLRWLQTELEKSRLAKENVHIIGHVPPGSLACSKVFSRNYYYIVANYSSIVKAQFFGHLHKDTFRIYFNPKNKAEPVTTQWISPSLTSYGSHNPAYRIYYADADTLEITNHETYIFDLQKANANNSNGAEWFRLYSAKEAYGVPNVKVNNLAKVVDNFATSVPEFQKYFQFYHKGANANQSEVCGTYCRKRHLCRIVRPYFGSEEECNNIQVKVDGGAVPIYDSDGIF